jgi:WD40 repeat protein
VWDLDEGDCLLEWGGYTRRIETLAAPVAGQLLSAGDGGDISQWDSKTGERLAVHRGHTDIVTDLDGDANGATMVSVSYDRTVRRWKLGEHSGPVETVLTDRKLVTVSLSPDFAVVAYGGVGPTVEVWTLDSDATQVELGTHEDAVVSTEFTANGTQLVTIDHGGRIRWWERDAWEVIATHELTETGDYPLAVSSELVAVGTDQGISLFDTDGDLRSELDLDVGVAALAIGRGGSPLVAGTYDGRAIVYHDRDSH